MFNVVTFSIWLIRILANQVRQIHRILSKMAGSSLRRLMAEYKRKWYLFNSYLVDNMKVVKAIFPIVSMTDLLKFFSFIGLFNYEIIQANIYTLTFQNWHWIHLRVLLRVRLARTTSSNGRHWFRDRKVHVLKAAYFQLG